MNWLAASLSSGLMGDGVVAKLTVPRSPCFLFRLNSGLKVAISGRVAFFVTPSGSPQIDEPPSLSAESGPSGSPV